MLKLSKITDYGVVILVQMCRDPERLFSANELAEKLHLGKETVAKCLKLLAREGILESRRGVSGGYALVRKPQEISVAEVVKALEGPVQLTECIEGYQGCSLEKCCPVRGRWDKINQAVIQALTHVSMQEMSNP